jgi:hypothetical protein
MVNVKKEKCVPEKEHRTQKVFEKANCGVGEVVLRFVKG